MKLRFNRNEMAEVLSVVSSVAAVRTPKEILKGVHIEAQSDVVLLSATDLELGLRCAVTQVEVEEPGTTVVVAETLSRITRECSDEVLAVESAGNLLHVRGLGSHFQIVTHDVADFPPVPTIDGDADFAIEHGRLRRLVELTVFSAAKESTRYAINGVLWELGENQLTLAATDGRRLSVARGDLLEGKKTDGARAILPAKTLGLLGRIPISDDSRVAVQIAGNRVLFDVGRVVMSSALVEGQFPKYQDVVPDDCDRVVELDTAEFHSALKRAALLTNEESAGVRFAFSEGNLTLSSRAPEQGEAEISIPVEYSGETLEIGFNPVFLLELLRVVHTDRITLALKDASRPGVIRTDDDFVYVVMPVNLSSG
ncbi:MAG: DNA polymerase III subunit beta [Phycisphaerae bacterium]|jgi:DNA polymerase-3 subunit beta